LGAYHFQGFEHGNYKCDVVMVQIPDIQNLFSQKKIVIKKTLVALCCFDYSLEYKGTSPDKFG